MACSNALLERIFALTDIVVIKLAAFDQSKAVSDIEPVGSAIAERADAYWKSQCIGLGEDLRDYRVPNATSLFLRPDVKVVEKECAFAGFDDDKANALAVDHNVAREFRRKPCLKAFPCANRIKPANALKALSHSFDANSH